MSSVYGPIQSEKYGADDIIATDSDGDGFYCWGIGPRPDNLAAYVPLQQDGDDSDADLGPIDKYGYCMDLNPETNAPMTIDDVEEWDNHMNINRMIYVGAGGVLIVSGDVVMHEKAKIFVSNGGKLLISSGIIENADIDVSSGGCVELEKGGAIKLGSRDTFASETGRLYC